MTEHNIHWADQFAQEIIDKKPDKKEYLVESGITPSGRVHAGNFREVMTQDLVYKALLDKGVSAKYIYMWDDYDRFRKVPKGISRDFEQYIGLPLSKVPDPWGCHKSYADHFKEQVIEEGKKMGVRVEYLAASEEYPKGTFVEKVKTALEHTSEIKSILDKFRKEPLPLDWLPVRVYCQDCGKDTTKAKYLGEYDIEYTCECGHSGTLNFKHNPGNAKLSWRIDWPMRWSYYDVDFESSGKDHQASGGSVDTGKLISKQVFNHEPPIQPMYEFIAAKGQKEKMSSSAGNLFTVEDMLEVYEPEVIRYIYTSRINRYIEVDFGTDLPNLYNYYDLAERHYFKQEKEIDENEARRYWFSQLTLSDNYIQKVPFSVCANAIQIANFDINRALDVLKKTGHLTPDNTEHSKKRLALATTWVKKYAPDNFKFIIQERIPSIELSDAKKELLNHTARLVEKETDGDELQQNIYEKAKELKIPLKEAFQIFYILLLNKPRGPKLGPFLASLDKEFVSKRLKLEK